MKRNYGESLSFEGKEGKIKKNCSIFYHLLNGKPASS